MKRFTLIALLGVLLSVAFAGTAQASPEVSFTVNPNRVVVGQPITVVDTTSNPEELELTHEWAKAGFPNYDVRAGSPECLNANCSQARWTYSSPGTYEIDELVSWPGAPDGGISAEQKITVVSALDAPAPIVLNGPTTVGLPQVLDVMSPKPHLKTGGCAQPVLKGTEWEFCEQYLVKRVGPDASGFYHYRFRLPMAYPGTVELTFVAWNESPEHADIQTFTINVTGNAYRFGDVRSCYWPTLLNPEGDPETFGGARPIRDICELHYYAAMNSRVEVKLQAKEESRWVTKKVKKAEFRVSTKTLSPWTRRDLRARLIPANLLGKNQRVIYEIKQGRKLLKRGNLSKRRCTWP